MSESIWPQISSHTSYKSLKIRKFQPSGHPRDLSWTQRLVRIKGVLLSFTCPKGLLWWQFSRLHNEGTLSLWRCRRGTGLNYFKVCLGFKGLMQKHWNCFLYGFKYLHFSYSDCWVAGKQIYQRERERKSIQWMGAFSQLGKCENGGKRQKQAEQERINSQNSQGLKHLGEIAPTVCFSFWQLGSLLFFLGMLKWLWSSKQKEAFLAHKYM